MPDKKPRAEVIADRGMRRSVLTRASIFFLFSILAAGMAWACGADMGENGNGGYPPPDGDGNGSWSCSTDLDCPPGLVCRNSDCVSADDERPPEEQLGHVFMKPHASARFIFALSPHTDTMAIIDAVSLAIETVPLAAEPNDLAVLPGRDAVAVVSREGRRLTVLEEVGGSWRATSLRLDRRFPAISVCPEGRWAVLWTPDGQAPDSGAEGIVALVDLDELLSGGTSFIEKAAGRRHTDVFFRRDGDGTADIVVVGSEEIAVIEIEDLDRPVPHRIVIPTYYRDIRSRQVTASADGTYAILRSFAEPALLVFDTEERSMTPIPLPAVATDFSLVRVPGQGPIPSTRGVVALRSIDMVGWFDLEEALIDPDREDLITTIEIEGVVPGQVAPSSDGRYVAVFTNSEPSDAMAWIDFIRDEVLIFDRLQKWIRGVGIGPDGRTAIVLHRPNPGSTTADPYERAVDKDEGYSLVDLHYGFAQLKLTEGVPPKSFVFSVDGRYAAVVISDGASKHRLDTMDLTTLNTSTMPLASAPRFAGALPDDPSAGSDRIWVTQEHPAGRISFVSLGERIIRTVTGYHLNAEIE